MNRELVKEMANQLTEDIIIAYDRGDVDSAIYRKGDCFYLDDVGIDIEIYNRSLGFTHIIDINLTDKPVEKHLYNFVYSTLMIVYLEDKKERKAPLNLRPRNRAV